MRIALGAGTDLHAPMGATEPVVALDHVEPGQATGARSFQVLHGPHNGSTRATMFVGYIPPGKAPWHYHLYDEIVWILRGEGRLHIGDDTEPLAPGVAFRLRPREVHIVENTQTDTELAVLGIFTPAGSPSAAYLEPHVAGSYAFSGQPRRPVSVSDRLARVVQAHWFTTTILVVIVANAAVLGLETYAGIDERYGDQLDLVNDLCFVVFVVELCLRIGAYGRRPWDFFRDGWNVFDFIVIAIAFVPGIRQSSTLLRLARLARVVRIVRFFPDLRVLLSGVWRSIPPLFAIGLATGMLLFVYGMVGWTLFARGAPRAVGEHRPGDADALRHAHARELPDLHGRRDGGAPVVVGVLRQLRHDRGVRRDQRPDRDRAELDGGGARGRAAERGARAARRRAPERRRSGRERARRRADRDPARRARRARGRAVGRPEAAGAGVGMMSDPVRQVLVLQHIGCEPPGVYEDVLRERGATLVRVELDEGEALPELDGIAAIVAMGGPMSVNDEQEHPWLVAEKQLICDGVGAGIPFFGACLGVQLLASSLGARVTTGGVPEVGVLPVFGTDAALDDPVFSGLAWPRPTLQWHSDTFELPDGATLLATSPTRIRRTELRASGTGPRPLRALRLRRGERRWAARDRSGMPKSRGTGPSAAAGAPRGRIISSICSRAAAPSGWSGSSRLPAGVADVQLRLAAGELRDRVAEARVVEDPERPGALVHRDDVVDGEGEVRVRRRLVRALEEVQLEVTGPEPLHGKAERRRRSRLEPEHVDVEARRLLEVVRDDADVVEPDGARHQVASPAAMSRARCTAVSGSPVAWASSRSHRTDSPAWKIRSVRSRPASRRPTSPPASRSSVASSWEATRCP